MTTAYQIELRNDTAANWTSANPVLGQGELGVETDTGKMKCGNGTTVWTSLSYLPGGTSSSTATENVVALGNVTGSVLCDLSQGTAFTMTATGAITVSFTNWPAAPAYTEPVLYVTQDSAGGHAITVTGCDWLPNGTPPTFDTAASHLNIIPLASPDQGVHLYGQAGGVVSQSPIVLRGLGIGVSANNVTTATVTVPASGHLKGSHLAIAVFQGYGTAPGVSITGVADSRDPTNNIYTVDATEYYPTGNTSRVDLIHCNLKTALQAGDAITFTFSGTISTGYISSAEFINTATTEVLDGTSAVAEGGPSTTYTIGPTGNLTGGELVIGCVSRVATTNNFSINTGWTVLSEPIFSGSVTRAAFWVYQVAANTSPLSLTVTASAAEYYAGAIAAYKAG